MNKSDASFYEGGKSFFLLLLNLLSKFYLFDQVQNIYLHDGWTRSDDTCVDSLFLLFAFEVFQVQFFSRILNTCLEGEEGVCFGSQSSKSPIYAVNSWVS